MGFFMKKFVGLAAAVGALALLGSTAANATLVVSASVGGAPTGVSYVNFDDLPLGNAGGTTGGVAVSFLPDGQTVSGAVVGVYAAPYLSNNNGVPFGDPNNGADTTHYVTTGLGSMTLQFPILEKYVGLLWGSVDTYNTLTFYDGATIVGSLTGTDVTAGANGDQGVNGTFYVNVNSDVAFDKIVATSSQYAFEIDNVAYDESEHNPGPVPEPLSLSLFGAGLLSLAGFGARKRRR